MPLLIENIQTIVVWLIIIVVTLTAGFILVTIQRRITRSRYFHELDLARQRARDLLESLYEKNGRVDAALGSLQSFRSEVERRALEEILLAHTATPAQLARTREILQKLGWNRGWEHTVRCRAGAPTGQLAKVLQELGDNYRPPAGSRRVRLWLRANFLERCFAADKLTRVPTPEGLLALMAGTRDPHGDVQEVCVRNLGRLVDPATLPVLIEEMIQVIEGRSRLSVRNLKTALVQFPLDEVDALRQALEHPNRRVRFFATDIIREIADRQAATELLSKNDFSPDMYRLFTEKLSRDEWGDVRARAALVIAHFHDSASNSILENLLQDEAWFVRLHACRAAAGKFFMPIAPAVSRRVSDTHWLVREAAVRSLQSMGDLGVEHIIRTFLTSQDRYAAEQICEEIQRSGLLVELLAGIDDPAQRQQTTLVTAKMAALGKVTMLLAYLVSPVPADLKLLLIDELSVCYTPECLETLRRCSEQDEDEQVRSAAFQACQTALAQAEAAAGAS